MSTALPGALSKATVCARVLLVEDYEPLRYWMSRVLEGAGYRVTEAGTAAAARSALAFGPFDVVVLDAHLPDVVGLEFLSYVHNQLHIPTIMASGFGDTGHQESAITVGADDYLVKPFSADELVDRVRVLVGATRPSPAAPWSHTGAAPG